MAQASDDAPEIIVNRETSTIVGCDGAAALEIPPSASGLSQRILSDHFRIIADTKSHRSICGVFSEHAPFYYSVGNTLSGLPELVVCGFPPHIAGTLINTVSDALVALRRNGVYVHQETLDFGDGCRIKLRLLDAYQRKHLSIARVMNTYDFDAYQMIVPTKDGYYPGEDGYIGVPQSLDDIPL